jgi:pimeloyl-ACP methyl ester carboxylesterase/DNA-binding CsgD family transcriptional regulator
MSLEYETPSRFNHLYMAGAASDLESGDPETARFLQSIDRSIAPAGAEAGGSPVTLPANALAAAIFDPAGQARSQDARFAAWFDPEEVGDASRDWLRGAGGPALIPVRARNGATTVVLLARVVEARGWALPTELRDALDAGGRGRFVALAYRPFEDQVLAERALASWRLTPVEARTVLALISAGDLMSGAKAAGVGYETARKALKLAMRKANARRQTDLVRLLHAAVGGGDLQLGQAPLLRLALGLSDRSAGASVLLALGLTRAETAATLRISEHALKDELKVLYDRYSLRSSTDLTRLTTEAAVLLGVAGNPNLTLGVSWSALRPLRFINRQHEPGRIALSDFGPASGEPVLMFHSATTGALLDRGLVRALQARGLRPIAVERPGFGLTDPPQGGEPHATAVEDLLAIMEAFGLKRVRILARGGERVALEFGLRHPERLARAVLINPFTPYEIDSRWDGYLNGAKRTFVRFPHLIEPLARFLAQRSTPQVVERLMRDALRSSAPDTDLLNNPEVVEDYVESARITALRTTWGFVHDQRNYLTFRPQRLPEAANWTRIVGAHDVLYRPGDSDDLWTTALPGHRLVHVPDGGRLLHASHPQLMAEELLRPADSAA